MGLRIATNVASMNARRMLEGTTSSQEKSYQRVASGQRITNAGDDAAGLAISENLRAQIRSMNQALKNANDGVSFVQVAEGGFNEIGNILVRMRELAIQAGSDTVGDVERGFIDKEIQSLKSEIDRIANVTTFNGTPLLNGEAGQLQIQVGMRNHEADRLIFDVEDGNVRTDAIGIDSITTTSIDDSLEMIDTVHGALDFVNGQRAKLGAMQNKLQSTIGNLSIARDNLSHARSRIADTDIAEETSKLVQGNILQSAGIAVLAQANNTPQQALTLL